MAFEDHVFRSGSEAAEMGKKGGRASGRSRRKRKQLREYLEVLLGKKMEDGSTRAEHICQALIEKALTGDARSFELIRDTLGEKPADKISTQAASTLSVRWAGDAEAQAVSVCDALIEAQREEEMARKANIVGI